MPPAPAPSTVRDPLDDPGPFRAALLGWYDRRARDLPWRGTGDPYAVWVSEVMLQQTRVETAAPYFRRWMERFPDVETLADAPLDDVLKAWEGLGYYSRARNLHRAASAVRDRHGGAVPDSVEALRELPGVGAYTAGAVASIAWGRPVPAVDGNVRRVLARLQDDPAPRPADLGRAAGALVDPERPGDFNQALMELGATVCTPRSPTCRSCPVGGWCLARARGTAEEVPAPRRRGPVPSATFGVALLVRDGGGGVGRGAEGDPSPGWRVLLTRRPEDGMLGGLWGFPCARVGPGEGPDRAAARAAAEAGGSAVGEGLALPGVDHVYSHLKARYEPRLWRWEEGAVTDAAGGADGARWLDAAGVADAALPRAQRAIARSLRRAMDPEGPEPAGGVVAGAPLAHPPDAE